MHEFLLPSFVKNWKSKFQNQDTASFQACKLESTEVLSIVKRILREKPNVVQTSRLHYLHIAKGKLTYSIQGIMVFLGAYKVAFKLKPACLCSQGLPYHHRFKKNILEKPNNFKRLWYDAILLRKRLMYYLYCSNKILQKNTEMKFFIDCEDWSMCFTLLGLRIYRNWGI